MQPDKIRWSYIVPRHMASTMAVPARPRKDGAEKSVLVSCGPIPRGFDWIVNAVKWVLTGLESVNLRA